MRKKGYGFRIPHRQFVHRYLCLVPSEERKRFRQKAKKDGNQADGRSVCEEFLRRLQTLFPDVLGCMCEAAIGTTQIFFRQEQERALQQARYVSARKDATCIARYWRGLLARRVCRDLRVARKLLLKGAEENDPTRFREARAQLEAAGLELYVPPSSLKLYVDRLSSVHGEAERLDMALERASSSAGVGSKKELAALYTLIHRAHELRYELACVRISAARRALARVIRGATITHRRVPSLVLSWPVRLRASHGASRRVGPCFRVALTASIVCVQT